MNPEKIANDVLNEDLVKKISALKSEPQWMLDKRLEALRLYKETPMPDFAMDLSDIDKQVINYYVDSKFLMTDDWNSLDFSVKNIASSIGIKDDMKNELSGFGFQYDSNVVFGNLKKELELKGVIFESLDTALKKYPELVKKYFMNECVSINLHKFSMLHAALWSGGTFIYVPSGVVVDKPLHSYFRMQQKNSGQFEHTLIIAEEGSKISYIEGCSNPMDSSLSLHCGCVEIFVEKSAVVKYSSIENWSRNVYNLNTKRAIVYDNASIEWLNGNMGSCATMLYPTSVLLGNNSKSESLGIAFAEYGQYHDIGSNVIHIGKNTSSIIRSKSISLKGGKNVYRGLIKICKNAVNAKSYVECDSLLLDCESVSFAYPKVDVREKKSLLSHEAKIGKISSEMIYYLMSRGFNEDRAKEMIIGGFVNPLLKKLPLEYAAELNRLIDLRMDGHM